MRSIGIVGAGQAGIVLAAELLQAGYRVSLYSDRTPEDYLADRGRPTACLFRDQVERERALGLNFWDDEAPPVEGIHLDLCTPDRLVAFSVAAPFRSPGLAVDQRLKFSRGIQELERHGATVVTGDVSLDGLDALTEQHDLVVVTAGRGAFGQDLFARDPSRSTYDRPRRRLFMINIHHYDLAAGSGHEYGKFTFLPGVVEIFWVPFYDKDVGVAKSVVLEAVPGGPADRFGEVTTAEEGLGLLRALVHEYFPWEDGFLAPAKPTSPITWLKGGLVPTVRAPVATLPSGRHVLGLGDAVVLNDPIAGQGANNATRMAGFFADRIVERGDAPFDPEWLTERFDEFWARARFVNDFTNTMLEPLKGFQQDLLLAASRKPAIAERIFEGFNDPSSLAPWFFEPDPARAFLAEHGISRLDLVRFKLDVAGKVLGHKVSSRLGHARPAAS